jgi:hypothetical protein
MPIVPMWQSSMTIFQPYPDSTTGVATKKPNHRLSTTHWDGASFELWQSLAWVMWGNHRERWPLKDNNRKGTTCFDRDVYAASLRPGCSLGWHEKAVETDAYFLSAIHLRRESGRAWEWYEIRCWMQINRALGDKEDVMLSCVVEVVYRIDGILKTREYWEWSARHGTDSEIRDEKNMNAANIKQDERRRKTHHLELPGCSTTMISRFPSVLFARRWSTRGIIAVLRKMAQTFEQVPTEG